MACYDCVLAKIHDEFPDVARIYEKSDNASCFKNWSCQYDHDVAAEIEDAANVQKQNGSKRSLSRIHLDGEHIWCVAVSNERAEWTWSLWNLKLGEGY